MTETQKKKLLIVITKSNFGGAQRYVYDLSRSLKNRYDITVACGGEGLMKQKIQKEGVRIVSIPFLQRDINPFKDILVFFWTLRLIHKEKPAIIHANSSKIGGIVMCAAHLMHVPRIIFTAHAWAFNENRRTLSKILITFFHWLTVALSHQTIAVSEAVKRQIGHTPFIDKKITVVHLGLEPHVPLDRSMARAKLGLSPDEFTIGTIAELHPVKGLNYALDALKELTFPYSYILIGEGQLKQTIQETVNADSKLQQSVRLTGFIPDAATLIQAFDVFLLPSLSEAFGYVLLEAGLAKTPVIATSVGGIPEIITDMKSGILIHPKNDKEISRSLTFLHDNPENRRELAQALYDKVTTDFSLAKMTENTVAVYESSHK